MYGASIESAWQSCSHGSTKTFDNLWLFWHVLKNGIPGQIHQKATMRMHGAEQISWRVRQFLTPPQARNPTINPPVKENSHYQDCRDRYNTSLQFRVETKKKNGLPFLSKKMFLVWLFFYNWMQNKMKFCTIESSVVNQFHNSSKTFSTMKLQ